MVVVGEGRGAQSEKCLEKKKTFSFVFEVQNTEILTTQILLCCDMFVLLTAQKSGCQIRDSFSGKMKD